MNTLFVAKVMAELFLRLKLPIVLGELLAGIIMDSVKRTLWDFYQTRKITLRKPKILDIKI